MNILQAYVVYDTNGTVQEVKCRVCGERIVGYVDVESEMQKVTDSEIYRIVIRQQFRMLDNYAKFRFDLSDGSFIEMPFCADCVGQVKMEHFGDLWRSEIAAWTEQARLQGTSESEPFRAFIDKMSKLTLRDNKDAGTL